MSILKIAKTKIHQAAKKAIRTVVPKGIKLLELGLTPLAGASVERIQHYSAITQLSAAVGPGLAAKLLPLLEFKKGRFYVDLYQDGGDFVANGRKYTYPGMKNSPIVLGSPHDISFYQVEGIHPDNETQGTQETQAFSFLNKYVLMPTKSGKLLLLTDNHNHALFGWALAKELGLTDVEASLIHVDAHLDADNPDYARPGIPKGQTLADFKAWSREFADIASFLMPGYGSLFGDVTYVNTKNNGKGSDYRLGDQHGWRQEGQVLSVELMANRMCELKAAGKKVILDLDLDYFAHYFQHEPDSGVTAKQRISLEENLQQVIALARQADFITVATSPDWFFDQPKAIELFNEIVKNL